MSDVFGEGVAKRGEGVSGDGEGVTGGEGKLSMLSEKVRVKGEDVGEEVEGGSSVHVHSHAASCLLYSLFPQTEIASHEGEEKEGVWSPLSGSHSLSVEPASLESSIERPAPVYSMARSVATAGRSGGQQTHSTHQVG